MDKYCYYCMNKTENDDICSVCGHTVNVESDPHQLLPGTVLHNRYIVGRVLGQGGFGITYIGKDLNLDMLIAIKEYYPNGYVNRNTSASLEITASGNMNTDLFDRGKKRFLDEARVLAKFSGNKNIVEIRDYFESNNTAYIVMEYVKGITLSTHLKIYGSFAPDDIISKMMPVFESLKYIHANGLIHRDISPDNIMIVKNDTLKLMDFGAARQANYNDMKSLSIVLKRGYAPEEQYRSKGFQGPWTDVYASCATIYKCITDVTPDESTERVYCDNIKPPSYYGIVIKPEHEAAIMKGMAVYKDNRFKTIDELICALSGNNADFTNEAGDTSPLYDNFYDIHYIDNKENISDTQSCDTSIEYENDDRENTDHSTNKGFFSGPVKILTITLAVIIILLCFLISFLIYSNNANNANDSIYSDNSSTTITVKISGYSDAVKYQDSLNLGDIIEFENAEIRDIAVNLKNGEIKSKGLCFSENTGSDSESLQFICLAGESGINFNLYEGKKVEGKATVIIIEEGENRIIELVINDINEAP